MKPIESKDLLQIRRVNNRPWFIDKEVRESKVGEFCHIISSRSLFRHIYYGYYQRFWCFVHINQTPLCPNKLISNGKHY